MRAQSLLMSLAVLIASGWALGAGAPSTEDWDVRVFTTMRLPNPVRPWAKQDPLAAGRTLFEGIEPGRLWRFQAP